MHELGHTVGLIHSGAGPSAYGDESGYMVRPSLAYALHSATALHCVPLPSDSSILQGYGDKAVKWPRKCFNALNHWQLGVSLGRMLPIGFVIANWL
jgi:hypothetical protein